MSEVDLRSLRRFTTGVKALDEILDGGVPAYSVVVLAGEPGTGKTILSQQMLFANAARGGKGLYLTTLSESPIKAARYQSAFTFFDPDRFGESVIYMDVGETIRRQGLTKATDVIADALRANQPDLVVIDSFKAIHDLAKSPSEVRSFAYDLAVELSAIQSTSFLVGEYAPADVATMPEFAVADGIIWLALERLPSGTRRTLRVMKMRGVANPTNAFSFDISREGINLFAMPAVVPSGTPEPLVPSAGTGIPGLDDLFRGSIPSGSPILVSGEAGTGKTTLGMQYLYRGATEYGERGVYFSYEEPPQQIQANARSFGWDLAPLVESGLVTMQFTPLPQVNPDAEILRIRDAVAATGARRAVVDSLTMLMHEVTEPDVVRRHVFNLTTLLKNAGCTAIITTDPPVGSGRISRFGVEESLMDGVIVLKQSKDGRERKRYLEIYKMRGANHASGDNLMRITGEGIRVYPRTEEVMR